MRREATNTDIKIHVWRVQCAIKVARHGGIGVGEKKRIGLSRQVRDWERYRIGICNGAREGWKEPLGHEAKDQSPLLISINGHLHSISAGLIHANM